MLIAMDSAHPTLRPATRAACFISYRHADNQEPGREFLAWLPHAIETYKVPADLVGKGNDRGETIPAQIFPVFRDEEESASGDLKENVPRSELDGNGAIQRFEVEPCVEIRRKGTGCE